jgi:hypothetical protein
MIKELAAAQDNSHIVRQTACLAKLRVPAAAILHHPARPTLAMTSLWDRDGMKAG